MKLCTLYKFSNEEKPPDISISVVGDDHQFGWVDGSLHIEGKIEIKERPHNHGINGPPTQSD